MEWTPGPEIADFATIFAERHLDLEQHELDGDGWQIEEPVVLRLLEKLRRAGRPLGEYVGGRFYYGIKTGSIRLSSSTEPRAID